MKWHLSNVVYIRKSSYSSSVGAQGFLDELLVDVMAHLHAVLEVGVVVSVGTSSFNELVDGVDLGLVTNEALLNLVKALEDVALEQLVLLCVVLHVVVGYLFLEAVFVLTNHLPNDNQAGFFLFEVALELISLGEFV
jgi:hypothetical protein